jgi:hypothetical protein
MIAPKHTAKSVILDLERGLRNGSVVLRGASMSPLSNFDFGEEIREYLEIRVETTEQIRASERERKTRTRVYLRIGTNIVVWVVLVVAVALDFLNASLDTTRKILEIVAAALFTYNFRNDAVPKIIDRWFRSKSS